MGLARETPVASEGDRIDRCRSGDSPNTLSAAPFQTRLPPPVAMSLRTRESSSLALKQIFDQINASTENSQPVDSTFGRTVAVLDKRDDEGKRDGPGVMKEFSGMARSAGSELDARQRTGGVHLPRKQSLGEEWASFSFKSSDSRGEEITGQQVNRGPPPLCFADGAQSVSQLASEKDSKCGFRKPERTVAPRLYDAGGNGDYVHTDPQDEHAGVSPQSPGVASAHLRKRLPELDLSFRTKSRSHDSASLLPAGTAFGSPIPASSRLGLSDSANLPNSTSESWYLHTIQQDSLPQAASRPCTVSTVNKQPTAQLTIFYSGTVNVYDDVPADKANAIMLLAGHGNSWSTNNRIPPPERENIPKDASPPAPVAVSANVALGSVVTSTTPSKPFSPSAAACSPPGPSTTPTALAAETKPQTLAKPSRSGIELPHARKASLARFLEKRKDRVQVKQQAGSEDQENDKSPTAKKQRSARSRSPSPTRSAHGSRLDLCNSPSMGQPSSATAVPRRFLD